MKRVLVLCTHNSARSQMAEGWIRYYSKEKGLELEIWSAGTEKTIVKRDAILVMREVGIDISNHTSKALYDIPIPWRFDVVITVCDDAKETCPAFPVQTVHVHISFPDPSGQRVERWREVRDDLGEMARRLVIALAHNRIPIKEDIEPKQFA
jgi:arsenate reductase (thioredoxin)